MTDAFSSRTELLLQPDGVARLQAAHVLVVGLGGVGGYAAEQLCRAGVGKLTIVDGDTVSESNLNRQLIALRSTVGQPKAMLFRDRFHDINPNCQVTALQEFLRDDRTLELLQADAYDCVVDCIDTVSAKMELVRRCTALGVPIISSMGAANKLDATAFRVADISETDVDPLARIMRKKLRKGGIEHFKCVFSKEQPREPLTACEPQGKRPTPASNAWVPAAAGIVLGGEVVQDLISKHSSHEH